VASYRVQFLIYIIIQTSAAFRDVMDNQCCGDQMRLHTPTILLAVNVLKTQEVLTVTNDTGFSLNNLPYTYVEGGWSIHLNFLNSWPAKFRVTD
jgi:hypothetical protein